jgi:hypothetical protein
MLVDAHERRNRVVVLRGPNGNMAGDLVDQNGLADVLPADDQGQILGVQPAAEGLVEFSSGSGMGRNRAVGKSYKYLSKPCTCSARVSGSFAAGHQRAVGVNGHFLLSFRSYPKRSVNPPVKC